MRLRCARPGSRGGQCHRRGGRQTLGELDYASLMRGDRRHSLPPPISLSPSLCTHMHTHSHTDICILSNCPPCLRPQDYFVLFISATCRGLKRTETRGLPQNITIQKGLAPAHGRCIIQITVRALNQSFMWISSSWLENREEAGMWVSFPVCNPKCQEDVLTIPVEDFYKSFPSTRAQPM